MKITENIEIKPLPIRGGDTQKLKLSDLHNPDKITAILHNNGLFIEAGENQAFQETKGRWELWQKDPLICGRLLCVKAWNKSAVIACYKNYEPE